MKFDFENERKILKLKNVYFHLKYHNSNKFQYCKPKILPNTLKT